MLRTDGLQLSRNRVGLDRTKLALVFPKLRRGLERLEQTRIPDLGNTVRTHFEPLAVFADANAFKANPRRAVVTAATGLLRSVRVRDSVFSYTNEAERR